MQVVMRMSQLRDEQDEHDRFGATGSAVQTPSFEQVEHAYRQFALRAERVGTRKAKRALGMVQQAVEALRYTNDSQSNKIVYNMIAQLGASILPASGLAGFGGSLEEALATARQQNREELGLAGMGAAPDVSSLLSGNLITKAVQKVTLRTSITPEMSYAPGSSPGDPAKVEGSSFGKIAMSFIKPELEIQTPAGTVYMAPNGRPSFNYFPFVAAGFIVLGVGSAYFIGRGILDALGWGRRKSR